MPGYLHERLKYEYADFLNQTTVDNWIAVTEVGLESKRLDIAAVKFERGRAGAVVFEVKAERQDLLGWIHWRRWEPAQRHGALVCLLIPEELEGLVDRVDPSVITVVRRSGGRWDGVSLRPEATPSSELLAGIIHALRLTVTGRRDRIKCECLIMLADNRVGGPRADAKSGAVQAEPPPFEPTP